MAALSTCSCQRFTSSCCFFTASSRRAIRSAFSLAFLYSAVLVFRFFCAVFRLFSQDLRTSFVPFVLSFRSFVSESMASALTPTPISSVHRSCGDATSPAFFFAFCSALCRLASSACAIFSVAFMDSLISCCSLFCTFLSFGIVLSPLCIMFCVFMHLFALFQCPCYSTAKDTKETQSEEVCIKQTS